MSSGCLLPLGDSLTQGAHTAASYRYSLWKKLVDESLDFTWTGSVSGPAPCGSYPENSPGWPVPCANGTQLVAQLQPPYKDRTFPTSHEGHSGWFTDTLLDGHEDYPEMGKLKTWMEDYVCAPTCALLLLGTNDMIFGRSAGDTIALIRSVILLLQSNDDDRASNGKLTILLAMPIPTCSARLEELQPLIRQLACSMRNVFLVEQDAVWNSAYTYDGCHPNSAGEELMAASWLSAIRDHCVGSSSTQPGICPPAPPASPPSPPAPPQPPPLPPTPPLAPPPQQPPSVTAMAASLPAASAAGAAALVGVLVVCYALERRRRRKRSLKTHAWEDG